MIEDYPNDLEKMEELLEKETESIDETMHMVFWNTRKLVQTEFNDEHLKKEIEELCGVYDIQRLDKIILQNLIEFIKSEKPTDAYFKIFAERETKRMYDNLLEAHIRESREIEEKRVKERETKFESMNDYSSFEN